MTNRRTNEAGETAAIKRETMHLWQNGREAARVPLDTPAALTLAESLLREVRASQARDRKAAEPPRALA
jgi:hypothetical protein